MAGMDGPHDQRSVLLHLQRSYVDVSTGGEWLGLDGAELSIRRVAGIGRRQRYNHNLDWIHEPRHLYLLLELDLPRVVRPANRKQLELDCESGPVRIFHAGLDRKPIRWLSHVLG